MSIVSVSPIVYNKTMTTENVEVNQELPAGTKKFLIKCRTSYAIKLAFVATESGTNYITVPADRAYKEEDLSLSGTRTLYFQCATAGQVAEIVVWT